MNRVLNPFDIKPGDLKLCLNYNSDTYFAKTKRTGYSLFLDNPDSAKVWNLVPFDRADGHRMVGRISGSNIYKYEFSGGTWGSATKTNWGGTNDQRQTVADATSAADATIQAGTDKLAQSFKISGSGSKTFSSFWILLKKTGSPGTLTAKIETDNAGSPSGTALTNSTITNTGSLITDGGTAWTYFYYTTNFPSGTAGTTYWLTLTAAGCDGSNYYTWLGSINSVYSDGQMKFSTDSGTTYNTITGEADAGFIINIVGSGSRTSTTVLNNLLVLSNGINPLTTTSDLTNFTVNLANPPAKYIITWKGRVYAIGVPYAPSRLYFSAANDPTNWVNDPLDASTGGFQDIDPDHNGSGIGLDVENDRLIVHKDHVQYKIIPDEFGRPAQVVPLGEPTTSHWSIAPSNEFNVGFFFGRNGFSQQVADTPSLISTAIQDLIDGMPDSQLDDLAGHFFKFKYFCTMGSSVTEAENMGNRTFTNPLFVYDIRLQEIYMYTTAHETTTINSWLDQTQSDNMYTGDIDGQTFKWDGSFSDNNDPIVGEMETWEDNLDAPHLTKRYEYISLETNPGCVSSAYYNLDKTRWIDLGDLTSGAAKVYFGDGGFNRKNYAIKVTDNSTTTPSVFYGYVLRVSGEEIPVQAKIGKK